MLDRINQVGLYVALSALALVLAVIGAAYVGDGLVLMQPRAERPSPELIDPLAVAAVVGPGRVVLSYGVLVALVGNYLLCRAGARAAGTMLGGALPALGWLAMAVYIGAGRGEGDVVIPNSGNGVAFLLVGTLSAAVGIARSVPRQTT